MEHIVQFGISIDDEAIKKKVEDGLYNDIYKHFVNDATSALNLDGYWKKDSYKELVSEAVKQLVEENRDEIIKTVVTELVDKTSRSKAFKDLLKSGINSVYGLTSASAKMESDEE